jgi:hypothetical protein
VWLSADCATPSFAQALVKLRARDGEEDKEIVDVLAWHS